MKLYGFLLALFFVVGSMQASEQSLTSNKENNCGENYRPSRRRISGFITPPRRQEAQARKELLDKANSKAPKKTNTVG